MPRAELAVVGAQFEHHGLDEAAALIVRDRRRKRFGSEDRIARQMSDQRGLTDNELAILLAPAQPRTKMTAARVRLEDGSGLQHHTAVAANYSIRPRPSTALPRGCFIQMDPSIKPLFPQFWHIPPPGRLLLTYGLSANVGSRVRWRFRRMRPLNIGKIGSNRYELVFDTSHGKLLCDISVAMPAPMLDMRSDADKLMEALKKAKALAHALETAIEE